MCSSVSSFVILAAIGRADSLVREQASTVIPAAYFDQLAASLDAPEDAPDLRGRQSGRAAQANQADASYHVEPLAADHHLDAFDCGHDALTVWLHQHARHATGQGTRTFLLIEEATGAVAGVNANCSAMDRYLRAFENGTMPEETCAPRRRVCANHRLCLSARQKHPSPTSRIVDRCIWL